MIFLNESRLAALPTGEFRNATPYPWVNPDGLLTAAGYRTLVQHAPDPDLFHGSFGKARRYGQVSHDRYALDYDPALPIDDCWHAFVAELRGSAYQEFICRLFDVRAFEMRLHWHYTPHGCSVSPHCDADRKIGSHIFYLNTVADWRAEWGGQTLILDDGGRFDPRSAPAFDEFRSQIPVHSMGNHSLIFARKGHSWHGVRPIRCPPDSYRRAFIVVLEKRSAWSGAVRQLGLKRNVS